MLAGHRPFVGETDRELLQNIIHTNPEPLPEDLPAALCTTVEKALEKEPTERYQTSRDLVVDLRHTTRRKSEGPSGLVTTRSRRVLRPQALWPRALWMWVIAVVAAVLIAAMVWRGQRNIPELVNPIANATFMRLTDYEGAELDASISPDGKFVAFLSDREGHFGAWLIQIGTGKAINLTPGPEDERAPLRSLGFSYDGSEIWLAGTETRKVRMLPLVGGEPRVFLGEKAVNPVWSPDGGRLAYHTLDAGDPIFIADRDGANARQIFRDRPDMHNHFLSWGPDGEWIYFVHGTPATAEMDLWRIRASGGAPERLTQLNTDMRDPTPLGKGNYFVYRSRSRRIGPAYLGL